MLRSKAGDLGEVGEEENEPAAGFKPLDGGLEEPRKQVVRIVAAPIDGDAGDSRQPGRIEGDQIDGRTGAKEIGDLQDDPVLQPEFCQVLTDAVNGVWIGVGGVDTGDAVLYKQKGQGTGAHAHVDGFGESPFTGSQPGVEKFQMFATGGKGDAVERMEQVIEDRVLDAVMIPLPGTVQTEQIRKGEQEVALVGVEALEPGNRGRFAQGDSVVDDGHQQGAAQMPEPLAEEAAGAIIAHRKAALEAFLQPGVKGERGAVGIGDAEATAL